MSYAATEPKNRSENTKVNPNMFLDPTLIKAARKIYQNYSSFSHIEKKPLGVIVNSETYKGQLTFRQKPILLPRERFVGMDLIEA